MSNSFQNIRQAYDEWAEIYDTNENPTRDLNRQALREISLKLSGKKVLEIGCGTGLNTGYLAQHAKQVIGIDFSKEMLDKARQRIGNKNVQFQQADITEKWLFSEWPVDLVVANLVLEHIEELTHIFNQAYQVLSVGGQFYIAELHPYKQLQQSQAKFTRKETGEQILVEAFTHPVSEYINKGIRAGFGLAGIKEYSSKGEGIPRLLTLLFEKK